MKKVLIFISTIGILAFLSCGPSAEETAKIAKMRIDSANAGEQKNIQNKVHDIIQGGSSVTSEYVMCPDCQGHGTIQTENGIVTCPTCNGTGQVKAQ